MIVPSLSFDARDLSTLVSHTGITNLEFLHLISGLLPPSWTPHNAANDMVQSQDACDSGDTHCCLVWGSEWTPLPLLVRAVVAQLTEKSRRSKTALHHSQQLRHPPFQTIQPQLSPPPSITSSMTDFPKKERKRRTNNKQAQGGEPAWLV